MAERAWHSRIALSVLAYAEVYSTFARRLRETLLTTEEHAELVDRFERDWQSVIAVAARPPLIGQVPRLVKEHPLRGADAVHLASALALREAGLEVTFAVADGQLVEAAALESLEVFNPLS